MGCNIKKILPSFSNKLSLPYTRESVFNVLEIEGIHKSGNLIPLDLTIAEYSINTTKYFTYIVRDITERKYREQLDKKHLDQLAHVTRLGLMGEMASGLAHEVNQPLTAIVNYTQVSLNLLKKENPDLIKLAEVAVKTQDQALRAGQIIHGVKRFCKATSQKRIATDINELINDSANLCADSLKQNCIKLTLELTDNLPLIQIDHIQIEQVILNLIRNGIDAILSTSEKRLREIIIQSYLTPNNEIQVRVKDNGSGIEEDQQVQILMPFHTTKSDGMGMGLSISRSLIEAHNGTLNFNSQFGKGSTFYITLPIIS
jgi:C4-dicarboxylate-specific signal transduction histidine kinase